VSLERSRMNYVEGVMPPPSGHHHGVNTLRRTPGANVMHRSAFFEGGSNHGMLRRTPGASTTTTTTTTPAAQGHPMGIDTAAANNITNNNKSNSFLGFGLMLSTPVGADRSAGTSTDQHTGRVPTKRDPALAKDGDSPEIVSLPPSRGAGPRFAAGRNPHAGQQHVYTPSSAMLSRNPHLNNSNGRGVFVFSPNTILLTESLDNLLHDDDEPKQNGGGEDDANTATGSARNVQMLYHAPAGECGRSDINFQIKTPVPKDKKEPSLKTSNDTLLRNATRLPPSTGHAPVDPIIANGYGISRQVNESHKVVPLRQIHPSVGNREYSESDTASFRQYDGPKTTMEGAASPGVRRTTGGAFAPPVKVNSPVRRHYEVEPSRQAPPPPPPGLQPVNQNDVRMHMHPPPPMHHQLQQQQGMPVAPPISRVYSGESWSSSPNNRPPPMMIHHCHQAPSQRHPHHHYSMPPPPAPHMRPQYYYHQQPCGGPSWSHSLPIPDAVPREEWNPHVEQYSYYHPNNTDITNGREPPREFYPQEYSYEHTYEQLPPPPPFKPPSAPPMSSAAVAQKQGKIMQVHSNKHTHQHRRSSNANNTRSPTRTRSMQRNNSISPVKPKTSPKPAKGSKTPSKKVKNKPASPPLSSLPADSPSSRLAFKDFYKKFRLKERKSSQQAIQYAHSCLDDISLVKIHWKIHLELADLSKRCNNIAESRQLYETVCDIQPYASQGWLEYSKLEEECGDMNRSAAILEKGLSYCDYSENLLIRCLKHYEKMNSLDKARELLSRLKHVGIEKVWRTVLEGALMECRAGNVTVARRVLKYLMKHVPWYGPLYLEAYKLERDAGKPMDAVDIVERGLKEIPRYGPLWFGAFRLCEGLDLYERNYHLPRTLHMMERATESISRELLWKVHLEAAMVAERMEMNNNSNKIENRGSRFSPQQSLSQSRTSFARTVLTCPTNLCWKVWLAGGRMELAAGETTKARKLFLRAYDVVPEKGRPAVLLECARLEEFTNNLKLARAILSKARKETSMEWKVWLESVALETRSGRRCRAVQLARQALEVHSGTGRLWAALVQLMQEDGERKQSLALRRALRSVPKSGEVWCEGARLHLNPFSPTFDLEKASQHLQFATQFTPQYGDSFLESLRLELLLALIKPVAEDSVSKLHQLLQDNYGNNSMEEWNECFDAVNDYIVKFACDAGVCGWKYQFFTTDGKLHVHNGNTIDTSHLELRCSNADPNYGLLWFHCRRRPTDIARIILSRAKCLIASHLSTYAFLYIAATVRRAGLEHALLLRSSNAGDNMKDRDTWDSTLESQLRAAPCLSSTGIVNHPDVTSCSAILKDLSGSDFVTGLTELNRHVQLQDLSLFERRKVLFGSDSLLS